MRSVTVDVDVIWKKDGVIVPIALYWPMDANGSVERYGIDEAVPTTSRKYHDDPHYGVTYSIKINGQKRRLILRDDVWTLETAR